MKKKRSINYWGYFHPWSTRSWRKHWGWSKKLENVPWAPKKEIQERRGFPQNPGHPHSHGVSAAMVGSRMDLKGWVLKVWVLQGADITTRLDKQEICWEEDLWRIKGASRSRQGKPSEREQVWVCERREGRRIAGRALDWYTVLRKPG